MITYGLLHDIIKPEDYLFGGGDLDPEILCKDGQWDAFLPPDEYQYRNGLETANCTAYGTLNCLETLMWRKFGVDENYSERYVGIMANTDASGNSPHTVIEAIRHGGVIKDDLLPFSPTITTLTNYYSPKPLTLDLSRVGEGFLKVYTIGHDWVFANIILSEKQRQMKEALKYSPIGVSVYAWRMNTQGLYFKLPTDIDCHWTMCYGYEEGEYWKIFDDYDQTHKKLTWDYDFSMAKRYSIEMTTDQKSFLRTCFEHLYLALTSLWKN